MAEQLQKEDAKNRKDSPHASGSELGVSRPGGDGAMSRVGNTQFVTGGDQGQSRPEEYASVSPIYSNAMVQDMQMLHVPPEALKATNLGDAYQELFTLSQQYPGVNPKAYFSELKVNVVPESAAQGAGDMPGGSVLFVQYSAEDLANPQLSGDLDALQNSETPVYAALNPSWTGLTNLVGSGKFNSVVLAGNGQTDAMSAVDASGLNDEVTAEEILQLIQGSSIQNVVLASAAGTTGMSGIASALQQAGLNVMEFMDAVGSDAASAGLSSLVSLANQMGAPGFTKEVFEAAAAEFDAGGGALIAQLLEFEKGGVDIEEMAAIRETIVPEAKSTL